MNKNEMIKEKNEILKYKFNTLMRSSIMTVAEIQTYHDKINKCKSDKIKNDYLQKVKNSEDTLRENLKQIDIIKNPKEVDMHDKFRYYLYNILTDEMVEIKCEFPKLIKMVEFLIYSKYFYKYAVSDEKFMESIMALKSG
jgi:hypothetical protein